MNKVILAVTTGAVAAAAGTGRGASRTRAPVWYARLRKPAYVPPNYVFPIAWTTLYAGIAVTSGAALDRMRAAGDSAQFRCTVAALAANLVLNAGWSWLFFRYHKLGASPLGAAVLTVSSADLARRVGQADTRAGAAILAYPLWCGFATLMSTHIWRLNR